jgi:hypothetical protein
VLAESSIAVVRTARFCFQRAEPQARIEAKKRSQWQTEASVDQGLAQSAYVLRIVRQVEVVGCLHERLISGTQTSVLRGIGPTVTYGPESANQMSHIPPTSQPFFLGVQQ